jgi:uridylate kinase
LINLTNVKGVYTKDPKKHKDAKLIKKIEINELIKLVLKTDKRMPGTNTVLDLISFVLLLEDQKYPQLYF